MKATDRSRVRQFNKAFGEIKWVDDGSQSVSLGIRPARHRSSMVHSPPEPLPYKYDVFPKGLNV